MGTSEPGGRTQRNRPAVRCSRYGTLVGRCGTLAVDTSAAVRPMPP